MKYSRFITKSTFDFFWENPTQDSLFNQASCEASFPTILLTYHLEQKYKLLYLIEVKTWPTKLPQSVRFQIYTCRVSISQTSSFKEQIISTKKILPIFLFFSLYISEIHAKDTNPLCVNLIISLSFRFYMKSLLGIVKVKYLPF